MKIGDLVYHKTNLNVIFVVEDIEENSVLVSRVNDDGFKFTIRFMKHELRKKEEVDNDTTLMPSSPPKPPENIDRYKP